MIEQTEAERQGIEKAAAEKAAAEKRTAEADDRFNRLLRGEPSNEHQQQPQIREKLRKRLEGLALDEDNPEDAAWAQAVLDGKVTLNGDPIKPKPSGPRADGGEGQHSPARIRSAGDRFNDAVRDGLRASRGLPKEIDLS